VNSQYRERLVAIASGYLNKIAQDYLNGAQYDRLHFTDDSKTEYRSPDDVQKVVSATEAACSRIGEEIIEECEARGLDTSKSENEIYALLMSVLSDNDVANRIYQKIDSLVSDLS
jgi:hypothetical protein